MRATASDASHNYLYQATIPASRPANNYTLRPIPHRSIGLVPLESAQILWQR
jgi:hypothetical protein